MTRGQAVPLPASQPRWLRLDATLARRTGLWAAVVFVVALLTRWLFMSVPIDIDEGMWIRRGPLFVIAILRGDWAGTYLRHHPGVTNMWITGAALSLRYALRSLLPAGDVARQSADLATYLSAVANSLPGAPLWAYVTARAASAVVTSASLAGIYALSRRIFGPAVALLAAAILLFEPFFLAYQRSITTDANQANFTWLALLAFVIAGRSILAGRRGYDWLALSGVCYGLAGLSKVSALLSLPAFGLWAAWLAWSLRKGNAHGQARRTLWPLVSGLALWALAAAATLLAAWPALWHDPGGTLVRLVTDVGDEVEGHFQFFLGQTSLSPGWAFYPVALAFRSSPALLLGSLLGLAALATPAWRRFLTDRPALLLVLADVAAVPVLLAFSPSKIDRYIVPVMPGLALLAAAGIWAALSAWSDRRHPDEATPPGRSLSTALAGVVVLQFAVMLPHAPALLTYFNPLLGGPAVAQRALMIGNGELLDRAAAWLNQQPGAADATTASWYTGSFAPYYRGRTVELVKDEAQGRWPVGRADYAVLYANQFQRRQPPEVVRYFGPQRPLYTVRSHGVDYVRVYPGPSVAGGQLPASAHPIDLTFGTYARLVGYELQTPELASGDTAVVTLYWQPLLPFPAADFSVYLGVRRADGPSFGKADNLPVGGLLPVDQWQPGQLIRDAQQVQVLPGTPPGEYQLEIGFYSAQLGQELPVSDANGPRGTRVTIDRLKVSRPAKPAVGDLRIAHVLAPGSGPALGTARLAGYDWGHAGALRAGDEIAVTLLWQAGAGEPLDTQIYLELSGERGTFRRVQGHALGGAYPPRDWLPGELVRDTYAALLPADAVDGRYRLSLVAVFQGGEQVLQELGTADVQARPHTFTAPRPLIEQDSELGGLARLVGYDLPATAMPGEPLALTLYWEAEAAAERNYARFVHVLGADGKIVAQVDGAPGGQASPTTGWVPGEYVTDLTQLVLPADLPAGSYRLAVGLYDPAGGQRLADAQGRDLIQLSEPLRVEATR